MRPEHMPPPEGCGEQIPCEGCGSVPTTTRTITVPVTMPAFMTWPAGPNLDGEYAVVDVRGTVVAIAMDRAMAERIVEALNARA